MRRTLLALVVMVPSLALASGYSLPNTNPRDLGVAASAVAAQRDSGAAFALPAALARLDGASARLAGGGVTVMSNWKDPGAVAPTPFSSNATSVDTETGLTVIGNVSVAYGGKIDLLGSRGWGVGLGVQPFGGSIVEWPKDWPGEYRITKVNRQSFSGILSAGIELLPSVRLGGGLIYYYTMETLEQNAYLPLPAALGGPRLLTAKLDANGGALAWDASLEFDPIPNVPLTVAFDYKHQAVQTLDGKAKWTNVPALPPGSLPPIIANQDVQQNLTIPNTINVGVSYRVAKPLLVMATYTFDRWSVYERDRFVGDVAGAEITVPRNYGNGYTIRAGAEYDVAPAFQVRAGLQRDISGLDERHYSPTLPDASSWAGALGATYRFGRGLSVDAGVFYAIMDEVKAKDASPTEPTATALPLRGTYDTSALVWGLSVGWTPGQK